MTNPADNIDVHKYYFAETSFSQLMNERINKVLIICSTYDFFMLEEDGRIDEQIFNEYVSLNFRYPPQFLHASSARQAFQILDSQKIDLVITAMTIEGMDVLTMAGNIKSKYPQVPVVLLTTFSREVTLKLTDENLSSIDFIFSWLGNTDLLIAIIKLIEDRMNVEHDVFVVGVQVIILVEDSVRFYSSYLPNIYKIIFAQSKNFMREGLNEHQKMLRMRGRPKILLATNYEEAVALYEKYKLNCLGVITDISYSRKGISDSGAGIRFCKMIKNDDPFMPVLIQSSDENNRNIAKELNAAFINKISKTLSIELRDYIIENLSFGDFSFINPKNGKVISRVSNLKSLQDVIFRIPDESFLYHIERNHFSKWLNARALFPIAGIFKYLRPEDFQNLDQVRRFIFNTIVNYRKNKGRGIISKFYRDIYDEYQIFSRIGEGSLGGKARGLAFIDSLTKRNWLLNKYKDIIITIPRTVVLSTDVFDQFMEDNNLYNIALSDLSDEDILSHFLKAQLPVRIHKDLYSFISIVNNPIAIRSSSLLEDSLYQPFAGIYSTYMIPIVKNNECLMLDMLSNAIKSVYASVFYHNSKAYMAATSNVIDEEKMAIVLQEVCGKRYSERFYPTISGVARSINFYPVDPEKPEDGIVNIAFGLGKYVVEGRLSLRFSPKFPKKILQLSNPEMALRETQKIFYALDMKHTSFIPSTDDSINLMRLPIKEAENDGSLKDVCSVFDFQSNTIYDGDNYQGKKIITFANILKYQSFPLAEIIKSVLETGQKEMNNHIEIEFAVNLDVPEESPKIFNLLQIRPIVDNKETINARLEEVNPGECIVYSKSALGNGIINNIQDIVYVKPEVFDPARNNELATTIEKINTRFLKENKNFVLIGPGRWGSFDSWLGIPVKWPQISAARVIIESGIVNYRVDPSQGTHFFQNLTAFRVGYFTVNPYINDGYYDVNFLNSFSPLFEDHAIRHVHFDKPLSVKIDGSKNIGVILKPHESKN
jgi:CheY-like chemotaxis protein